MLLNIFSAWVFILFGWKDWQQLHKKATSYNEEILETTSHKTAAIQPPTSYFKNHLNQTNKTYGTLLEKEERKDKMISNLLRWTPSHRQAGVGQPARTYLQQLCADTGCSQENLLSVMDDRWMARVREICARSTTWWWLDTI